MTAPRVSPEMQGEVKELLLAAIDHGHEFGGCPHRRAEMRAAESALLRAIEKQERELARMREQFQALHRCVEGHPHGPEILYEYATPNTRINAKYAAQSEESPT